MQNPPIIALLIVFGWLVRALLILGFWLALAAMVLAYTTGALS